MWPFPVFAAAALALARRALSWLSQAAPSTGSAIRSSGSARFIAGLDHAFNRPTPNPCEGRLRGIAALSPCCCSRHCPGRGSSQACCPRFGIGWIVEALLATAFIAQNSLRDHVRAVGSGLDIVA